MSDGPVAPTPATPVGSGMGLPLTATALVVTVGVLPAFLTGALGVQVKDELGFGDAALGAAPAIFFLGAAITSFGFGRTAERIGPVRSMRLSAGLSGLSLLAVAVVARSWLALAVILFVGGVSNALAQPAANLYLARTVPAHRQGIAFAVKQSAIPIATLLGGLAVPVFGLTVGWRWAFVAGSALAVTGAWMAGIEPGAVRRARRTARQAGLEPEAPVQAPTRPRSAARPPRSPADAPVKVLALLGVGAGLGGAAAGTLGAFLVSSAVDTGMAESSAGLLAAAGSGAGLAARLLLGVRADRMGRGHLRTVAIQMGLGAVGFVILSIQQPWALVVATPLVFAAGWGWPGLFNLAIVLANPSSPGAATGITQTGTYSGSVIGPLVFGYLADHAGYTTAWLAAAGSGTAAMVAVLVGRSKVRAHRARVAAGAFD